MVKLVVIYLLITAALAAIAIYVQVNSRALSLPVSTGTTVLTIVLPLLAIVNFFYSPVIQRILQRRNSSFALSTRNLAPQALQLLQFALVVVLLTVSSESFLPGGTLACSLGGAWQRFWSTHDVGAIKRIQDAFNCCGFNSVHDREWPRYDKENKGNDCSVLYSRDTPCVGPWRAAMQRNAGLEFVVAAAVGVLQLVLFRLRVARNGGSRGYRQIRHRESADQEEGLVAHEENGANHVGVEEDDDDDTPRRDYGAIDEGRAPRIEPSRLGEERNHWRS